MLTAILILFILVLGVIIWILFTPLHIYISTRDDEYYLRLSGLFSIYLDKRQGFSPHLKTVFKTFSLKGQKKTTPKKTRSKKKPSRTTDIKALLVMIRKVLSSFKIKQFRLDIDSGDCITNAYLIALLTPIGGFRINDSGDNNLLLLIWNRPVRIAWPILKYWMKF